MKEHLATKIPVCLEIGSDSAGAFVPNCPGCWVFGRTPESAMTKAKVAVADWFEWLGRHGEQVSPKSKDFEVIVSEMLRVTYNPVKAGKPEPLFWSETLHTTRKDILRTLRLMQYSREDLLKTVTDLSSELLNWKPKNEPRTIESCLRHIAYVEPWYITRLNVDLQCKYPKDTFKMLNSTRDAVVNCLQNFPREKMRGIYQPTKDANPTCNLWTARKVIRRLVDHERLHKKYIERILTTRHSCFSRSHNNKP
jgi:predicted RNase H-like HicB family nuclease